VCNRCSCGAIRLFARHGNYACRFCQGAQYLSQKQNTATRKRLAAAKLRLKLGGCPDIRDHCHEKPNGSTKSATNAYAIKSKHLKSKPSKHTSAKKSTFAPSPITSELCAVTEFPRIEQLLGLDEGNQQPFISTAFGSPSEVRYVPSGP
jgi:hypothetical protein